MPLHISELAAFKQLIRSDEDPIECIEALDRINGNLVIFVIDTNIHGQTAIVEFTQEGELYRMYLTCQDFQQVRKDMLATLIKDGQYSYIKVNHGRKLIFPSVNRN